MSLKHDVSQHYQLKEVVEQLFGRAAWLEIKECTSLSRWKTYAKKILKALQISIEESIEISDEEWRTLINENLARGSDWIDSAKDFESLLSAMSATLTRQTFLQIGFMPDRRLFAKVSLDRRNWKLSGHRTVLVIQSPSQIEAQFISNQRRLIGDSALYKLQTEYRNSRTKLPYSQWLRTRGA